MPQRSANSPRLGASKLYLRVHALGARLACMCNPAGIALGEEDQARRQAALSRHETYSRLWRRAPAEPGRRSIAVWGGQLEASRAMRGAVRRLSMRSSH